MALRVKCKCGKSLKVSSKLADKKVSCPGCQRPFRIPAAKFEARRAKAAASRRAASGSAGKSPARSRPPAPQPFNDPASAARAVPASLDDDLLNDLSGDYDESQSDILTELDVDAGHAELLASAPAPIAPSEAVEPVPGDGPVCRSCNRRLQRGAKICVQCGINLKTGRSMITSDDGHIDGAYETADKIIRGVSWLLPFGYLPIASEGFGTCKPHVVRAVAILTVLISVWFWCYEWSGSPKMQSHKQLLLWTGEQEPTSDDILMFYEFTEYGDAGAFEDKYAELEEKALLAQASDEIDPDEEDEEAADADRTLPGGIPLDFFIDTSSWNDALVVKAHEALPLEQRTIGEYRTSQLLTNAFLHGGILHLVGNLIFLMIFGTRVNMLIGNIASGVLYPVLAVLASYIFLVSAAAGAPMPALGASGAIMGLAGMYLILFPIHKVHMAIWWRWGLVGGFHLSMKLFGVRGFWVVLFYIAFDVFFTVLNLETGTAHWAHLGGFIVGMVLALILLFSRLVNARGGDILSAILGKHAWALIGKPRA